MGSSEARGFLFVVVFKAQQKKAMSNLISV